MINKLFKKNKIIGIVGGTSTGKSMLALTEVMNIKEKYDIDVYAIGVEEGLQPLLIKKGIRMIHNKEDILDLKIRNSVILIDEFASLFSPHKRDKQMEKLKKFFNRIQHLNDYIIISTAEEGFWNKFMCGVVKAFLVKKVEFDSLVNGTQLKRKVKGIELTSEYRLDITNDVYYVISDEFTTKHSFPYNPIFDSKKNNVNPFKLSEIKCENKSERKNERKSEKK